MDLAAFNNAQETYNIFWSVKFLIFNKHTIFFFLMYTTVANVISAAIIEMCLIKNLILLNYGIKLLKLIFPPQM